MSWDEIDEACSALNDANMELTVLRTRIRELEKDRDLYKSACHDHHAQLMVYRIQDIASLTEQRDGLVARVRELEESNKRLHKAAALLNSMVLSGESHTQISLCMVNAALRGRDV